MPNSRGFTLIELLVVLVILGVVVSSIALSLPATPRWQAPAEIDAWRRQALRASRLSESDGQTYAWLVESQQARLQLRQPEGWISVNPPDHANLSLANKASVSQIEVDGQQRPPGSRIVFRNGQPPLFRVELNENEGRRWRIEGLASGRIRLDEVRP